MTAIALLASPLFLLSLTLGAYLVGVWLNRRTGSSLANPTLVAIVLVGVVLRLIRVPYATYFSGAQLLHFLLGPATVALAIPLVRSLEHLRRGLLPTSAALLAGSVTGAVSAYGIVRVCGGDQQLALTMLPKSLTTPIAMDVSQTIGGLPALTTVFAIAAGVLVAVALPWLMKVFRIRDAAAVGLAAGIAGSGIATARVVPMGTLPLAFAGVAIGMNGLITAALAPVLVRLLQHFWH
ncbi:MAG: LrgB family protein [Janthinobacterium lividum]